MSETVNLDDLADRLEQLGDFELYDDKNRKFQLVKIYQDERDTVVSVLRYASYVKHLNEKWISNNG